MMGYINDPESTARAFTNDGYLKSGDIGYISNVWEIIIIIGLLVIILP